jgi:hypothetical protein
LFSYSRCLTSAIDAEFANITTTADRWRHGTERDYTFAGNSATELISSYRNEVHNGGPLRILDVGTAAGAFLTRNHWQDGDVVQGITAQDYRENSDYADITPSSEDPRYIVGNAEYLDQLHGLENQHNVVVSKLTVQHFVDKLGSLEQIANRVAPRGLFCVDVGHSIGTYGPGSVAKLLERNGFSLVDPSSLANNQTDLVMRRGTDSSPVAFDLEYQQTSVEDLEESLDRPLTDREKNRLTLEYVAPS